MCKASVEFVNVRILVSKMSVPLKAASYHSANSVIRRSETPRCACRTTDDLQRKCSQVERMR
jgi:hypothetical protein